MNDIQVPGKQTSQGRVLTPREDCCKMQMEAPGRGQWKVLAPVKIQGPMLTCFQRAARLHWGEEIKKETRNTYVESRKGRERWGGRRKGGGREWKEREKGGERERERELEVMCTSLASLLCCCKGLSPSQWETGASCQLGFKHQQGLLERMMTSLIASSSWRALGYTKTGFTNPRFAGRLASSRDQLLCHETKAVKCRASI